MASMTVEFRNVPGTEAAMGWAGGHTIVVDRPDGKAGGMGLGFNGGQLLALAIGGCFCNDLRYVAHEAGAQLGAIALTVAIEFDGAPLLATGATMHVSLDMLDGSDPQAMIKRAKAISAVRNSVQAGFPVAVEAS
ncbi:MAG: OsmC family protein [Rhizobiaceae bacterium]|nr:OsmC family protein [Rhizobiaceae bacterium]